MPKSSSPAIVAGVSSCPEFEFTVTLFPAFDAPKGKRSTLSFDELLELLRTPASRVTPKKGLTLWAPATFRDDYRDEEHHQSTWGLGFDVDVAPVPSADELVEALARYKGFLISSSSHRTEAPRWRLVLVLSRPVTCSEYRRLHRAVRRTFSFAVGTANDATRQWYMPREPDEGNFVFRELVGAPVDVDAILATEPETTSDERLASPVTPLEKSAPDYALNLAWFEEHCASVTPPTNGGETFTIAQKGTRSAELPPEVVLDVFDRVLRQRCTPPTPDDKWPGVHRCVYRSAAAGTFDVGTVRRNRDIRAIGERVSNPNRAPTFTPKEPGEPKDYVGAERSYEGERKKLTTSAITQTLYNGSPEWDGVLWFDVLSQKARATDPPIRGGLTLERGEMSDGDLAAIKHWFDVKGMLVSKDAVKDAISTVVREPDRQRNVIAEYLDALPAATDAPLVSRLASEFFGNDDPLANVLVMKTLVAAVRRARQPGHFHKPMLVLKGEQQCGKTPFVKVLAGPWYQTTANGNLADRDTILECQGKWLVEVEELSALGKADANALKTAISRTADPITKKYEPDARTYLRSFVLIGTTNQDEFLTDDTGNSRYWPVEIKVKTIDLARLERLRDQVWAEADFLARSGMSNELDSHDRAKLEDQNAVFQNTHPWEVQVASYLAKKTEVPSATEVLSHIFHGDLSKATQRDKNTVGGIMRGLGWEHDRQKRNGRTVALWRPKSGQAAKVDRILSAAPPAASATAVTRVTRRLPVDG